METKRKLSPTAAKKPKTIVARGKKWYSIGKLVVVCKHTTYKITIYGKGPGSAPLLAALAPFLRNELKTTTEARPAIRNLGQDILNLATRNIKGSE